jgi:hypothetical protein
VKHFLRQALHNHFRRRPFIHSRTLVSRDDAFIAFVYIPYGISITVDIQDRRRHYHSSTPSISTSCSNRQPLLTLSLRLTLRSAFP